MTVYISEKSCLPICHFFSHTRYSATIHRLRYPTKSCRSLSFAKSSTPAAFERSLCLYTILSGGGFLTYLPWKGRFCWHQDGRTVVKLLPILTFDPWKDPRLGKTTRNGLLIYCPEYLIGAKRQGMGFTYTSGNSFHCKVMLASGALFLSKEGVVSV